MELIVGQKYRVRGVKGLHRFAEPDYYIACLVRTDKVASRVRGVAK